MEGVRLEAWGLRYWRAPDIGIDIGIGIGIGVAIAIEVAIAIGPFTPTVRRAHDHAQAQERLEA
jgi:hypothetical protein